MCSKTKVLNDIVRALTIMAVSAAATVPSQAEEAMKYHPVPEVDQSYPSAVYIQRTMRRLAESTPEKPNTVRILFYGQSITRSDWWKEVVKDLKARFPEADIVAENLAIGGFGATWLINTTPRDMREFYPDLVIFHVYGSHVDYEDIMREIRSRTTAEIAIQRDHYGAGAVLDKPEIKGWHVFMNNRFLPAVAHAYHIALFDVRTYWKKYLLDNGLESQALLRDGVHPNDHGNYLMAGLINQFLVRKPEIEHAEADEWIKTYEIGRDVDWKNGELKLRFNGNRVVALLGASEGAAGGAEVLIDGKAPSKIQDTYIFTRANDGPGVDWPWTVSAPFLITNKSDLVEEEWTITVTEGDKEKFSFRVEGSITGPDGAGVSTEDFVSDSGRIAIKADHWWTKVVGDLVSPIEPGYTYRFKSVSMGTDKLEPPYDSDPNAENPALLVSGIASKEHTLRIRVTGKNPPPIRALRVHCPPLNEEMLESGRVTDAVTPPGGNKPLPRDKIDLMP